ncbi:hypothetical protein HZS61_007431 [Fusarium oxysporum f. sp. conglutinans]|uniref:HTH CENPB-type domain-containing protein n=2 Tax=Fusarium oxysporum f. sp. conglutinans TaxID=100902 RepID=A0A8H6G855_FUSOX|nr:hypothetical protein HZS61_007431 [Fusarium oxysporum f. sp. conglutinans]
MVRRNYTEDDVAQAILDITDRGLSQNEASQKRGVPHSTLSGRLSGQASRNERIQAHQRISKSQEETLILWVLRQESLGYALSHSQLRACVEAILKQQGDNKPLGKHWATRFVKRHLQLSTKLGKRQEAARFDGFTPKAVNWYFDIRETEYGWIKPENTVNVDEGGIMAGFDKEKLLEEFKTPSPPQLHSDDTPKTSRQVREMAKHRSRPTRRKYSKIAKGLEALEMKVAVQNARITGLEEQMAQVRRGKKRKAVPNPNRRFMALAEALTTGEALPDSKKAEIEVDVDEKVESVIEVGVRSEDESDDFRVVTKHCQRTRSGREVKKPRRE